MKLSDYNIDSINDFDADFLLFKILPYCGLCDYKGDVVLEPRYSSIIKEKDTNFIIVKKTYNGKFIVIKKENLKSEKDENYVEFDNYKIIRDKYEEDRVYLIASNCNKETNKEEYIVLDKDGNIKFIFDFYIIYCNNGIFRTIYAIDTDKKNEWYKYYNSDTKEEIAITINELVFFGGYAIDGINKNFYIDKNGDQTNEFISCTDFHKSNTGRYTAIVKRKNSNTYDVIDRDLKTIFSVDSSHYELTQTDFDVYIITDKRTHSKGIIDITGNIIISCMYRDFEFTSNGIIKYGIIDYYDITGKEMNIPFYYRISTQNEKVVVFTNTYADTYAFFDNKGNNLFNTWFDSYDDVKNNRAIVSKKEISYETNDPFEFTRFSVVDLDGNIIFSYPSDDIYDSLESLSTLDHSCYIGKIKGSDEYILFSDSGFELKRFHSEEPPSLFDRFFSYKENGKYNLWFTYGSSVPIFDAVFDYVDKERTYYNSDYINVINRRCFECKTNKVRWLYIDCGGHLEVIDIQQKESEKDIQKESQKTKSLFLNLFKRNK